MSAKSFNSNIINEIKLKMQRFDSSGPGFSHSLQPYPKNMPQDLTYFQRSFEMLLQLYSNIYYSNKLQQLTVATKSTPSCSSFCTLFCGNLHEAIDEKHLMFLFRYFHIAECSKNWKNFGFVKFYTEDEACKAYVALNGRFVMGRPLRLEFQNKEKKNFILNSMKISLSTEFIKSRIQREFEVANRKEHGDVSNENTLTETLLSSLITSLFLSTAKCYSSENLPKNKSESARNTPFTTKDTCGYSSDSGCRSSSSLGNTDCSLDEESNISDDASDILTSSEYANDLDALNCSLENIIKSKRNVLWLNNGKVHRKKLEPGVYCSANETSSLYSKPLDILVKVASHQIKEYVLFPASN